jgi:hypothetical protein
MDSGLYHELDSYDISYHLFTGNTTLMFPTLDFINEEVPVGDSMSMCVHVVWAPKKQADKYQAYQSFTNFPNCNNVNSLWPEHDPSVGVNLNSWIQHEFDMKCTGTKCASKCERKGGSWSQSA